MAVARRKVKSIPGSVSPRRIEADRLIQKLSVTLTADQSAVDPMVQSIMQVIRLMPGAADKEDSIQVALSEALANAVVHGAQSDPSKVIECDVACDASRGIVIVVRDPGKGFDPARVPSPLVGDNLYQQHGRGIYLINQLMDDVKFFKNGAEIHMIKR
jgi:serine/threonine-protein kinase RsbW